MKFFDDFSKVLADAKSALFGSIDPNRLDFKSDFVSISGD